MLLVLPRRAELYDVEKAATRFVNHWEHKVRLWGQEKAFRKLSVNDFDDNDQEALLGGGIRVLPLKDRNGRGIIMVDRNYYDLRPSHRTSMVSRPASEFHDCRFGF